MENLPPLTSLVALDALYRTGSVTKAASLLGRTHGAVSKQLHLLQDHAGVSLLERQGTGLTLTRKGGPLPLRWPTALRHAQGL